MKNKLKVEIYHKARYVGNDSPEFEPLKPHKVLPKRPRQLGVPRMKKKMDGFSVALIVLAFLACAMMLICAWEIL